MKKTVNLVCMKDGWILEEMAERLSKNLKYINWTEHPSWKEPITYYLTYYHTIQTHGAKASPLEVAFFTHLEIANPDQVKIWHDAVKRVDACIAMSTKYAKDIRKKNRNTATIKPGVDLDLYRLRKIKIGVVGTGKGNGRKGEDIVKSVMDIEGIEWHFTGGKGWPVKSKHLSEKEMPDFYGSMDYILIPSRYEGGPMPALESLAVCTPIISSDVGWVSELPHIPFKNGSASSLRKVLESIVKEKESLRRSIENNTWKNFIKEHDIFFKKLLSTGDSKKSINDLVKYQKKH